MKLNALRHGLAGLSLALLAAGVAQAEEPKQLFFYNWTDYYPVELLAKVLDNPELLNTLAASAKPAADAA